MRIENEQGRTLAQSLSSILTMASSSTASISKKLIPELSELLVVAVVTFACQTGLRSNHKTQGNPVLNGVIAFFGHLIQKAKRETQQKLRDISPQRLGGWQPGEMPTPHLLTLVSSQIKTL